MKYLLDTHTLLWAAGKTDRLPPRIKALLEDRRHAIFVSAASAWEIATKVRLGKLADAATPLADFEEKMKQGGYAVLAVSVAHALKAGSFPEPHQDPFDRMLAAQALIEDLVMLSADKQLDVFGVQRLW
ncbi:MAG TPA: type II toxin-antitoxin system VapC family toxin [Acidobacteriaceae bacterium]